MARSLIVVASILIASTSSFVACSGSSGDDSAASGGDSGVNNGDASADSSGDAPSTTDGAIGDDAASDAGKILELPLTGCPETGFTAPFSIGGSSFALIVDTGSAELAVASSTCTNCTSVTPLYTPDASATDEHQMSTIAYASTEGYQGEIFSDTFAPSASTISAETKLISITSQTNGFFTDDGCSFGNVPHSFQGIAGMGTAAGQAPNTTAPFPLLVANGMPNIFSMALCGLGGNLWLGGFDPSSASAAPVYTAMTINGNSNYSINATAKVGATALTGTLSDLVVDSDTTGLYLPTATYNAAKTAIGGDAAFAQHFGGASFFANDDCIAPLDATAPTSDELDTALPTFTFLLDNGGGSPIALTLKATSSYLQPITVSGVTKYCPEINPGTNAVLGSSFLREQVVIYDIAASRIGFAPYAGLHDSLICQRKRS